VNVVLPSSVRTVVDTWTELLDPLLVGLPPDDQRALIQRIDEARLAQLDRKLHPKKRRRHNELGQLVWPEAGS
jgi:hypothetical protein